ncbi:MAG: hypothetical protein E7384_07620 [Ruminococcaceae bacterium]|nr:hypothetical protein [Oscillospiraceae bacterium]
MQKYHKVDLKKRGSISSFMCIFTAVVVLFNAVLTDCARMLVMRETLKRKVALCAESLTAEYMQALQREYGLYGLYVRDGESRRNDAFEFMSHGGSVLSDVVESFLYDDYVKPDLFDYDVESIDLTYIGNITEDTVLRENICELMKYKVPADLLSGFLEKTEMFEESTDICILESICTQAEELRNRVYAEAESIKIAIKGTDIGTTGSVCEWESFGNKTTKVQLDLIDTALKLTTMDNKTAEGIKQHFETLKNTLQIYRKYNVTAVDRIYDIQDICDNIREKIDEFYDEANAMDFSVETSLKYYKSTKPRINALDDFTERILYASVVDKLNYNIDVFTESVAACNTVLEYITDSECNALDPKFMHNQLEIIKKTKNIKCNFSLPDIRFSEADESLSDYDVSDKKDKCLDNVFSVTQNISIPDNLKDLLPSFEEAISSSGDASDVFYTFNSLDTKEGNADIDDVSGAGKSFCNMIDSASDSFLINQYITSFFYCNSENSPEDRFFDAEVEYIIAGGVSQKGNVNNVFAQILGIRTAMNFVHILSDSSKREFANQIGASMSGATMGIAAPVIAFTVMGIWATAEAAMDMIVLKEGKSVPFYKMKGDWRLDIGLENIGSAFLNELTDTQTEANVTSKESPLNMDYKDYLNILLLAVPAKTKLLRICDLIELNMKNSVTDAFDISEVYTGIICDTRVSFKSLVNLAILKKGSEHAAYEMRFYDNSIY